MSDQFKCYKTKTVNNHLHFFCLGEVLNDNFMNQAQQNHHNSEHIGNYNRFKTALMNINVNYIQSLNDQNNNDDQKYIQLHRMPTFVQFVQIH